MAALPTEIICSAVNLAEVDLKNALKQGIFIGVNYFIARQCLCMTGGHGSDAGGECDGALDCLLSYTVYPLFYGKVWC